jgi:hypothetical protein
VIEYHGRAGRLPTWDDLEELSMIHGFRRPLAITVALATATALLPTSACADDLPKRKSGLWEIKMSMAGMPSGMGAMQTCVDEKSDDLTQQQSQAQAKQACSRNDVKRDGERVVVHSVCQFDKTTATTDAAFTGRFDSGYRGDIKTTYDPPLTGRKETQMTVEAKWLGPCKAGQKPGDVIINGMTVNRSTMGGQPGKP